MMKTNILFTYSASRDNKLQCTSDNGWCQSSLSSTSITEEKLRASESRYEECSKPLEADIRQISPHIIGRVNLVSNFKTRIDYQRSQHLTKQRCLYISPHLLIPGNELLPPFTSTPGYGFHYTTYSYHV